MAALCLNACPLPPSRQEEELGRGLWTVPLHQIQQGARGFSVAPRWKPETVPLWVAPAEGLSHCVQVTLSGRDVERGFSVRTLGAQINAIPSNQAEGGARAHETLCISFTKPSPLTVFSSDLFPDLNCLTLTLSDCTAKSKNNTPVSTQPPLIWVAPLVDAR